MTVLNILYDQPRGEILEYCYLFAHMRSDAQVSCAERFILWATRAIKGSALAFFFYSWVNRRFVSNGYMPLLVYIADELLCHSLALQLSEVKLLGVKKACLRLYQRSSEGTGINLVLWNWNWTLFSGAWLARELNLVLWLGGSMP